VTGYYYARMAACTAAAAGGFEVRIPVTLRDGHILDVESVAYAESDIPASRLRCALAT
jgi:hypothetical protein